MTQKFEHIKNKYKNIIVAVSGGSDSLALLLILKQNKIEVSAVTVNHRIRKNAEDEAQYVSEVCRDIGVGHITLKPEIIPKNAQEAREVRYELLVKYAKKINADAIALGHTMDDQAETIVMRAKRVKKNGDTRGLAAMNEITTHNNVTLVRPLLDYRRNQLKKMLNQRDIKWVSDPSNHNQKSERVRIRQALQKQPEHKISDIAKLATLCQKSRKWINQQTADVISQNVTKTKNTLVLNKTTQIPSVITNEIFANLILVTGKNEFRTPKDKLNKIVSVFQKNQKSKNTVGHTIVEIQNQVARFRPENRNKNRKTNNPSQTFRPECDNPIFEAIQNIKTKSEASQPRRPNVPL